MVYRKLNHDLPKRACEMLAAGHSRMEIAAELDIHLSTVDRWVNPEWAAKRVEYERRKFRVLTLGRDDANRIIIEASRRGISIVAAAHEIIERGLPTPSPAE